MKYKLGNYYWIYHDNSLKKQILKSAHLNVKTGEIKYTFTNCTEKNTIFPLTSEIQNIYKSFNGDEIFKTLKEISKHYNFK